MRVAPNARKWGVLDEDMHHALRNAVSRWEQDENRVVIIGGDRAGQLLELVIEGEGHEDEDGDLPVIVHAMKLRPAWRPYI